MNIVATLFAMQPVCNTARAAHALCSDQYTKYITKRNCQPRNSPHVETLYTTVRCSTAGLAVVVCGSSKPVQWPERGVECEGSKRRGRRLSKECHTHGYKL